ncbi:hypothetical protein CHU98_g59 [Xylaria longipes]|nr:hypothetical protein CHU98_g59 [Xylaria longipes]
MAESKYVSYIENLLKYMRLDQKGNAMAEYIWIDAEGHVRSKNKTITKIPENGEIKPEDLPVWNFDGSSTEQAPGDNSDVYLRPVAVFPDPMRGVPNILVLCECWNADGTPNKYNYRHECAKDVVDAHYKACLYAGVKISGTNAEVMPAQWEFQVGPCEGIQMGDHLWLARFLLHRVAEEFGCKISVQPKTIPGDWNGAGLHSNFSTKEMRTEGGMKHIEAAIKKLEGRCQEHIAVYGKGNELRLTGRHETGAIDQFSFGIANRGASIRIPRECAAKGYGYFEDRRPASNADPYQITGIMMKTVFGPAK